MKTLILTIVAMALTGCAADFRQRMQDAANLTMQQQNANAQWRAQWAQQPNYQPVKSTQTDQQCFQGCMQAGYQYGLCQNKCSY